MRYRLVKLEVGSDDIDSVMLGSHYWDDENRLISWLLEQGCKPDPLRRRCFHEDETQWWIVEDYS